MKLRSLKKVFLLFTLLSFSFSFFSCEKFEEGPAFSFFSKKYRMVKNWQLKKTENQYTGYINETTLYREVWNLEEDGYFWKSNNSQGEWEFLTETTFQLDFSPDDDLNDSIEIYEITRLTLKEMWVKQIHPHDSVKYYFEKFE
jgi:hypothetical protein